MINAEIKDKNSLFDKIQFIIHSITFGLIYWLVFSALYSLQNLIIKSISNDILSLIIYIAPYILILWFTTVESKKGTWHPFGKISKDLQVIIFIITFIILYITIGFPKVSF